MRYWYHPESEALWTTEGNEHFHSDPEHMEGEATLVEELSEEQYRHKRNELQGFERNI